MRFLHSVFALSILCLTSFPGFSQNYGTLNHTTYGGVGNDRPYRMIPDGDGFMLVGEVGQDANLGGEHHGGYFDVLVARLDENGELLWSQNYGGSDWDSGFCIAKAQNGYIVGGRTFSNDGQISGGDPGYYDDAWLFKINGTGSLIWEQTFGSDFDDEIRDILVLDDGSIVGVGTSHGWINDYQGKIFKTDGAGNLLWEHVYGGSDTEYFNSLVQTDDGGFLVVGQARSIDGDVGGTNGMLDVWIVKTDAQGNLEWQKTYGGSASDAAHAIKENSDGTYIVVGQTLSDDGDVSEMNSAGAAWVLWIDEEGFLVQEATFGNEFNNSTFAAGGAFDLIRAGDDSGWIVSGFVVNALGENSGGDAFVFHVNNEGTSDWSVVAGGNGDEQASTLGATENGYRIAGYTESEDGDLAQVTPFGFDDLWLFDVALLTATAEEDETLLRVFPNPAAEAVFLDGSGRVSEVSLYGPNGALLKTVRNQSHIDVADLSPGLYVLQIKTDQFIVKRKLVVE